MAAPFRAYPHPPPFYPIRIIGVLHNALYPHLSTPDFERKLPLRVKRGEELSPHIYQMASIPDNFFYRENTVAHVTNPTDNLHGQAHSLPPRPMSVDWELSGSEQLYWLKEQGAFLLIRRG